MRHAPSCCLPYAQLMPIARRIWAQQVPDRLRAALRNHHELGRARRVSWPAADDLSLRHGPRPAHRARLAGAARAWAHGANCSRAGWSKRPGSWPALRPQLLPQRARGLGGAKPASIVAAGLDAPALALEAAVARIALEWAAASAYAPMPAAGRSGWPWSDLLVVLEGLQAEPFGAALAPAGRQGRVAAAAVRGPAGAIRLHEAGDPSDEAERAAACVLRHVEAAACRWRLAAIDRVLTRRIRAMLDVRGVAIRDETGWKLSTTRAAANVMRPCARAPGTRAAMR